MSKQDVIRTIRPGLLVSFSTSLRGNVSYWVDHVQSGAVTEDGALESEWNTRKRVADPTEHALAVKARTKVRGLVLAATIPVGQGGTHLCPEADEPKLITAIAEARRLTEEFNASSELTKISFSAYVGRIAQDDVSAVRAISQEIRDLMSDMEIGLRSLDVKAVREAANKAKSVGAMLSDDAKGRLEVAISAARASARKIVKAGDQVAQAIDREAIAQIDMARTSFLDLDMSSIDIVIPEMSGRAIDMEV
jgi:hypothetical protein